MPARSRWTPHERFSCPVALVLAAHVCYISGVAGEVPTDETLSRVTSVTATRPRPSARLRLVYPLELERTLPLTTAALVLGRDAADSAGLVRHPTVSRHHLTLRWEGGAHVAEELQSRNGSALNGRSLSASEPRAMAHGDVLRLGDVLLVYEQGPEASTVDASAVSRDAVPGESMAVTALRAALARAAMDPSPVMLIGETGTGKELLAQELHRLSRRHGGQHSINCAELARELVESQLFGHERGAFTGATDARPGLFRAAHGGTLFLDEIGELPAELQPKLLRVLQEGEVRPVGAARTVAVDVRVVAATNRDLAAMVETGGFRRDLYARLALWEIRVPPLRARRADLLRWVERLHARWATRRRGAPVAPIVFEPDAAEALLLNPWPENLRGLDRLVHQLAAIEPGVAVSRSLLPPVETIPDKSAETAERAAPPTKEDLVAALARHGGSVRAVAKHFHRDRKQVYRWLERFGLRADNTET